MKYGVEVVIKQFGYIEVEASCKSEAEHIAEQKALNGDIDFHDMAEFFGAFGNGYDYDDYFTPPAPVQEEEHSQSYYDGYGDGYY